MHIQRRKFLAASAALGVPTIATRALADASGVSGHEIVIGQSAVFSGPLGSGVKGFTAGANAFFNDLNARDGVAGRKIRLVSLDDELKAEKTVANCKALLTQHKAFCFFGFVGSDTVAAATAVFRESNAPLIGNYPVGDSAREKAKGAAYFVRASYGREAEKLVQHLATLGITKIAMATLDNPGGAEVLALVRKAVMAEGHAKDLVASAAMKLDGSNIVDVGKTLAAGKPQAVIVFIAGPPAAELIKTMWEAGSSPSFYGMSVVAGDMVAKLLGPRLRGLAISQVVTSPWSDTDPTARGFRKLCESGNLLVNYTTYEGYLNAMVLAEALTRAGRDLTRASLHVAMRSMKLRLAGMDLDFTTGNPTGSNLVDLVHVTTDGRFLR